MSRFDGSLALKLDFGATTTTSTVSGRPVRAAVRLAPARFLRGPEKYTLLEHRRRQAQINARRQLDLLDGR